MYNGIINVYKERGFTSFDVVAKLRGIVKQKKIGHTGTLDPDAEGVLPVCLGRATKLCDLLTEKDKVYRAKLLLGKETDTQDLTGTVLSSAEVTVGREEVERVIASFVGEIKQVPPMYSALKVNGKKLVDLARRGIEVERQARMITIHDIVIEDISLPYVTMTVHCSKGTYIRTLCHDIGEKLGCHGCMASLVRTRVSVFPIEEALTLSKVEEFVKDGRISEIMIGLDQVFQEYPVYRGTKEQDKALVNGNSIMIPGEIIPGNVRVYKSNGVFIGLYAYEEEKKRYQPVKMFYDASEDVSEE
ncbi:MAG: tRNA pseudouridine(55) synthase TruB [Lachnospiraceae bacterium]|nr:tRNA pseudouridine(55) synthase TruB [Lachnospiraceae bacterium]